MYTVETAAAAVGRNKTAILRAISAGRISVAEDETGEWQIDPAELHRIYPPLRGAPKRREQNISGSSDPALGREEYARAGTAPRGACGPLLGDIDRLRAFCAL